MHDLQLVGFTTDRRGLIFRTQDGTRAEESFVVPVTDELVSLVTQLGGEQPTEDGAADEAEDAAIGPVPPRADTSRPRSLMSVRDIQARLRAGEPQSRIAAEAGVDEDWIERFAPPIRAEQQRIVERALDRHLERSRSAPSAVPLRRAVGMALADKGIAYTVAAYEAAWSARLLGHDRWAVEFHYHHRGRDRTASWTYDAAQDVLTTTDRAAAQLGYVPPGTAADGAGEAVDGIVGDPTATATRAPATPEPEPSEGPAPTAKKTGTRAKRSKATTKKKAAVKEPATKKRAAPKKKAAAKRSATKKRAPKQKATAKKSVTKKKAAAKRPATKKRAAAKKSATKKRAAPKKKAVAKKPAAAKKSATTTKRAAARTPAPQQEAGTRKATSTETAPVRETPAVDDAGGVPQPAPARPTRRLPDEPSRPATAPPITDEPPAEPTDARRIAGGPGEVRIAEVPLVGRGEAPGANGHPPRRPIPEGPAAPTAGGDDADPASARRARAVERNAHTVHFRSGSAAPVRAAGDADRTGPNGAPRTDETSRPRPERGDPDGAARPSARRRRQLRAR